MDTKVKNFVEKYNERMSWNRDIYKYLNLDPSQFNEGLQMFLDENLSTEDITEEGYDLETAKVYEYGEDDSCWTGTRWAGTIEMQVFSNKTYGIFYFWLRPTENESEYKKNRIAQIVKELDEDIKDKRLEIDKLTSEFADVVVLRKMFD